MNPHTLQIAFHDKNIEKKTIDYLDGISCSNTWLSVTDPTARPILHADVGTLRS